MSTTEQSQVRRILTPMELAMVVRLFREARQWSQEQLADISKVNPRTVQRVENGQASSVDTRRALAVAFGIEDIDAFNKPHAIPTEEEMRAQEKAFARDYITLKAHPVTSGQQLANLVTTHFMDYSETRFELTGEAAEHYAGLVDYYRDYRDIADMYSETEKLKAYRELQSTLEALDQLGVSVCYASRKVTFAPGVDGKSWTEDALLVSACQKGKEPEQMIVPRAVKIG